MTSLHRLWKGFTLLEVLVALAVISIGLGALWKGLVQEMIVAGELPDRIVAGWVAQNRIILRQSTRQWPDTRTYTGSEDMGGRKWYWQEQVAATDEPLLRRVTVRVGAEPGALTLFNLEAYLQRPRPPMNLPRITFDTSSGGE